jgi:hypothetical protein
MKAAQNRLAAGSLGLCCSFLLAEWAFTAATPITQLFTQRASGSPFTHGDYVSTSNGSGLDTYYSYFIEVPPGTVSLTVDVFDPDIGAGGGAAAHDAQIGGSWDTRARYTLFDPTGAIVITRQTSAGGGCGGVGGFGGGSGCNNAWSNLWAQAAPPLAGHWEIRVDMSSTVTAGDDVNGYGLRAHDGVVGAGGTELNIYAESYVAPGTFAGASRNFNLHPYVDSGCELDSNDFDSDTALPFNGATYTFNSRSGAGAFTRTFTGAQTSGEATWANNTMSGWTTESSSIEYGIWASNLTIN